MNRFIQQLTLVVMGKPAAYAASETSACQCRLDTPSSGTKGFDFLRQLFLLHFLNLGSLEISNNEYLHSSKSNQPGLA